MSSILTCIICPRGCQLAVGKTDVGDYIVTGEGCHRGKEYAELEMTSPVRVLTTTVKLHKGCYSRLPVKTDKAVPKEIIFKVMAIVKQQEVVAPVMMGEIIIKNIFNTGCNVIATKDSGLCF